MSLRTQLAEWGSYDDEMRRKNSAVMHEVLSQLPSDVDPINTRQTTADFSKALESFDRYHLEEDPSRKAAHAAQVKGYLFNRPTDPIYEEPEPVEGRQLTGLEALGKSFIVGLAQNTGAFFKAAPLVIPDHSEFQQGIQDFGTSIAEMTSDQMRADVALTQANPLWASRPDTPWHKIDPGMLPDAINGWASIIGSQLSLMLYSRIFGKWGTAAAGAATAFFAGGAADPSPIEEAAGGIVGYMAGSTVAMSAIEAANFIDQAEAYGIPKEVYEKYARAYGLGSGLIEGSQQAMFLGKIGVGKTFGKAVGKTAVGEATKKAKGFLVRKIFKQMTNMTIEGTEEVVQGDLMHMMLGKAMDEAKTIDNKWKPKYELSNRTVGDRFNEFAIGATVGAVMDMGRFVGDRLISGRADSETATATAKLMNRVRGTSMVMSQESANKVTSSLVEAFNDPKHNKTRWGKKSTPLKGTLMSQAIDTGDGNHVMYATLKTQYDINSKNVNEEYAYEQLQNSLMRIQGRVIANDAQDLKIIQDYEKQGKISRETINGLNILYADPDAASFETDKGLTLADRYGFAEKVDSVEGLTQDSFELNSEHFQDSEFMSTMLAGSKKHSPESVRKSIDLLKAFVSKGNKVVKNQNRVAVLTDEQLAASELNENNVSFTKTEDGIKKNYIVPSALSRVENGVATMRLTTQANHQSISESIIGLHTNPANLAQIHNNTQYSGIKDAAKNLSKTASAKVMEMRHKLKIVAGLNINETLKYLKNKSTADKDVLKALDNESVTMDREVRSYFRENKDAVEYDRVTNLRSKIMSMPTDTISDVQLKVNAMHNLLSSIKRLDASTEATRLLDLTDDALLSKSIMTSRLGYKDNLSEEAHEIMQIDDDMVRDMSNIMGFKLWSSVATDENGRYRKGTNVKGIQLDQDVKTEDEKESEFAEFIKSKYETPEAVDQRIQELELQMNKLPMSEKIGEVGQTLVAEHQKLSIYQEKSRPATELMTPEQFHADIGGVVSPTGSISFDQHIKDINDAIVLGKPINALAAEQYGIVPPVGWVKEGGTYKATDMYQVEADKRHTIITAEMSELAQNDGIPSFGVAELGAMGLHHEFVQATRKKRAELNTVAVTTSQWKSRVDAETLQAIPYAIEGTEWTESAAKHHDKSVKEIMKNPEARTIMFEAKRILEAIRGQLNAYTETMSEKEWVAFYNNYVPHMYKAKKTKDGQPFKFRTDSPAAKQRVYATYQEAEADGYMMQDNMNIEKMINTYAIMNWNVATNKKFLHNVTQLQSMDGDKMVVPVYGDKDASKQRMTDRDVEDVFSRLGKVLPSKGLGGKFSQKVLSEAENLSSKFKPKDSGYVWMDSPFKEYNGFWVHPDAVNVMKMAIDKPYDNKFVNRLSRFIQWSKYTALAFSLFHHGSMMESFVSAAGFADAWKPLSVKKLTPKFARENANLLQNTMTKALEDPEFGGYWIRHGLQVSIADPNINNSLIENDLNAVIEWAGESSSVGAWAAGKFAQGIKKYKEVNDKWLWQYWHPAMKLHTAQKILDQYQAQAEEDGVAFDPDMAAEQISQYVNNAFGGQEWENYEFATPKAKQMLHLGLFAPDWTLSNLQISGLPMALDRVGVKVFNQAKGSIELKEMAKSYWPRMMITMTLFPALVQAAIYGLTAPFREPEDDAELFSFNNESGQEFAVDITAIHQAMSNSDNEVIASIGKKFMGVNGKQRHYIQWAKQAREVKKWLDHPLESLYGKSSMAVKVAFEQILGISNLDGWETPWKSEDMGLVESLPSRAASITGKFVPMSLKTLAAGNPSTFFAPVRKGMSAYKATESLKQVLDAYARPSLWDKIVSNDGYVKNLDDLAPHILDAAERNGLNRKVILDGARNAVRSHYYRKFWNALEKGNEKDLEEAAESIIRLHAVSKGLHASMKQRYKKKGTVYASEKRSQAQSAFRKAYEDIRVPTTLSAESKQKLKQLEEIYGGSRYGTQYIRNVKQRFDSGDSGSQ